MHQLSAISNLNIVNPLFHEMVLRNHSFDIIKIIRTRYKLFKSNPLQNNTS